MRPHFTITLDQATTCLQTKLQLLVVWEIQKSCQLRKESQKKISDCPEPKMRLRQQRTNNLVSPFTKIGSAACAPINRRRGRNLRAAPAVVWVLARDLKAGASRTGRSGYSPLQSIYNTGKIHKEQPRMT